MSTRKLISSLALSAGILAITGISSADPLPGEVLKFQQQPLNGPNFPGHDEPSTAFSQTDATGKITGYSGSFMADDFADKFNTPVVHLRWWGSYQDNVLGATNGVQRFLVSFESDNPAVGSTNFSTPGQPLLNQIVTKGPLAPSSGTFVETLLSPPTAPGEHLYQYNAELNLGKTFPQTPDKVFWLKIVALEDVPTTGGGTFTWGWHNRDYRVPDPLASTPPAVNPGERDQGPFAGGPVFHFQDDAVRGNVLMTLNPSLPDGFTIQQSGFAPTFYAENFDGPTGISAFSKDLAFELYTAVPEPLSLWAIAFMPLAMTRRRGL